MVQAKLSRRIVLFRGADLGLDPDLALALELADTADAITRRRFGAPELATQRKPDASPVSEVDREVEATLRSVLAKARPGVGFVGEESPPSPGHHARWIVDPIDGTKNYLRGIELFATLIALEAGGVLQLGVVSAPALGNRWWATRGGGAFEDGKPIQVSGTDSLSGALISIHGIASLDSHGLMGAVTRLASRCWATRGLGNFWSHMLLARGSLDIAIAAGAKIWDLAAPKVIVEESGGQFTDLSGRAVITSGTALSTNGTLHSDALAFIGDYQEP